MYAWSVSPDERIKYYSGTAVYSASFEYYPNDEYKYYIELDKLYNTASIKINGNGCGTLWTPPYRREVTKALVPRTNRIEIAVTNTWANRIIGDSRNIPYSGKRVWTNAKFTDGITMQKSGIVGQVRIISAGSTD